MAKAKSVKVLFGYINAELDSALEDALFLINPSLVNVFICKESVRKYLLKIYFI